MSAAGTAIFNHDLVIADAGFIGSASDADAIAIASNGVVTFSQTPVNSAGAAFVTDDPTALAIALGQVIIIDFFKNNDIIYISKQEKINGKYF